MHFSMYIQPIFTRVLQYTKVLRMKLAACCSPALLSISVLVAYSFENEANFNFIDGDERVLLNVGGHVFPTTAEVLCRDRYSLLACVCKKTDSPIAKDEDGTFFFERDW